MATVETPARADRFSSAAANEDERRVFHPWDEKAASRCFVCPLEPDFAVCFNPDHQRKEVVLIVSHMLEGTLEVQGR
jgi:hypothetical protein